MLGNDFITEKDLIKGPFFFNLEKKIKGLYITEVPILQLDEWRCLTLSMEHTRTSKTKSTFCEQQFRQNTLALCSCRVKSKDLSPLRIFPISCSHRKLELEIKRNDKETLIVWCVHFRSQNGFPFTHPFGRITCDISPTELRLVGHVACSARTLDRINLILETIVVPDLIWRLTFSV